MSLCQCFGTLLAVLIVDKFGRRILLILSDVFMCITLTTLGFYFYMDENKSIVCDHPLVKDLLLDLASKNSVSKMKKTCETSTLQPLHLCFSRLSKQCRSQNGIGFWKLPEILGLSPMMAALTKMVLIRIWFQVWAGCLWSA